MDRDGRSTWFTVTELRVVDSRLERIALDGAAPRLTLVTCYPFDALIPGGPLRWVVTADAAAPVAPERRGALTGSPPPQKAFRPVSVRPMVSWWIVSVPS